MTKIAGQSLYSLANTVMCNSKNTLITSLEKIGCLDVMIIVMILQQVAKMLRLPGFLLGCQIFLQSVSF
jgi:hypothetical protein